MRILVLSFLLVLLATTVSAQADSLRVRTRKAGADSLRTLEIGVLAGRWYNELDTSPGIEQASLEGDVYGIALRYFSNRFVGFQAEIVREGGGWQQTIDTFAVDYRRELDYLTFQILTQVAPTRGTFRPLIQAGPYVSIPIGEKEFLPPGYEAPPPETLTYFGRPIDFRINYGLVVGGGLYLSLGRIGIQAEGRYLFGLSDLIRPGESQAATSRRVAYGGRLVVWYGF